MRYLSILCILTIATAFTGCGTKTTKYGNTVIEEKNGSTTYTDTKTGTKMEVNAMKLPEKFPKDVPIRTDATVKTSYTIGENISVGYGTDGSTTDVWNWYQTEMAKNGWKVLYQQTADNNYISSWQKGDNTVLLTIGSENGKTGVGIMFSTKTADIQTE